jgi:quercetin dioxygenase-like cupin family protein/uncharacterized protein YndB with AHSA1/START domain
MAHSGQILENPATGDRVVFEKTAGETDGALLAFEMSFRPAGFVAQEHLHPLQSERHEVLEGTVGLVLAGHKRTLTAGDVVVVPPGTPHRLIDQGPARMRFDVQPALRQEVLLETFAGLARDGGLSRRGMPGLLQLAAIAREFEPEGYSTRPPLGVQRAVFGALSQVARRRGIRGWYPRYSDRLLATQPTPPSVERADTESYVFIDEWDVRAPIEAVFAAVSDGRTYPDWWKPVYIDVSQDGPPVVGHSSSQHFKGRLPYHLHTTSTTTRLEPPHLVEAKVTGDLSGRGRWTLSATEQGTHVRFDWRVNADRPFIRFLTPLLRPLFRFNHNWAIARAIEGLEPWAKKRPAS